MSAAKEAATSKQGMLEDVYREAVSYKADAITGDVFLERVGYIIDNDRSAYASALAEIRGMVEIIKQENSVVGSDYGNSKCFALSNDLLAAIDKLMGE